MANSIVFDYGKMKATVETIKTVAAKYKTEAEAFQTTFTTEVKNWTGESKDKTVAFVSGQKEGTVEYFTTVQIPALLEGLAEMLAANITSMGDADAGIAEQIPGSLNG